jgi:hypothetical protein
VTRLDDWQLLIIDVLLAHGGVWTAGEAEVLVSLAGAVSGQPEKVGTAAYKRTSLAVLALERAELIIVERRYEDVPRQANIIERIVIT